MTTELPPQPTEPPAPTPLPDAPSTSPARSRSPLTTLLAGIVIGAGLVGGAWGITAISGPGEPETFTLKGTFELADEVSTDDDGKSCRGRFDSGYDDIAEGASVTVYGAKGDVVAAGSLGKSKVDEDGTTCTYRVAVPDVPKGEKFYKFEVAHRGTLQLTAQEAENGELAASLG